MNNRVEIKATYRIVTPMFIGDADQKASAIRPPSFKGALRFWWRALALGRLAAANPGATEKDIIVKVHEDEARIFGIAAEGKGGGQGIFLISVQRTKEGNNLVWRPDKGHGYLLGQGLYHFRNGVLREYIRPGTEFIVKLVFRPVEAGKEATLAKDVELVKDAMIVLGLLGGLGSRSRRGLGSVNLLALSCNGITWARPTRQEELRETIEKYCLNDRFYGLPAYTALSDNARIDISLSGTDGMKLLNSVGEEMMKYRSFKTKPVCNYRDDHDNAMFIALGQAANATAHPRRVVFGLPHNYFSNNWGKADVGPVHSNDMRQSTSEGRSRRASPLLIHIHELDGSYCAVQTLLPAQFLPLNDKIQMKGRATKEFIPKVNFSEITNYLDTFTGKETICPTT